MNSDRSLGPFADSLRAAAPIVMAVALALPTAVWAQDEAPIPTEPDTTVKQEAQAGYANTFTGEFNPGRGYDIIKTERGSLNISVYGLFRWLDQMPGEQTFKDHLGRERTVKARNDLNWHRSFIWISGFFYDPRLMYNVNAWALATTQQALVFGTLRFRVNRQLTLGTAIGPNLTARSMMGSWPYWAGSDRQMSEEFFRAGFSSSFFVTGEAAPRLYYTGSVNTNLSQLGVTAANDSRDMAYSGSVWWMPTTGEFGPRGGVGDLEDHKAVATRFGISGCTAREGRAAPVGQANNETQLRLSDGVYAFEEGALADTVTVKNLDYHYLSADAGFKYRGFSFQGEYYYRSLSHFDVTSPVPNKMIKDTGFMAEAMHMVVPKSLGVYVAGGYLFDEFKRNPWELAAGANLYPFKTRAWRVNLHAIHIEKCPTGSNFGYYSAGQTGTTFSLGTDFLL